MRAVLVFLCVLTLSAQTVITQGNSTVANGFVNLGGSPTTVRTGPPTQLASPSSPPPSLVAGQTCLFVDGGGGGSSLTCSFPNPITAGNAVLIMAAGLAPVTLTAQDGPGDTFDSPAACMVTGDSGALSTQMFVAGGSSGGVPTIQANFAGGLGALFGSVIGAEISGGAASSIIDLCVNGSTDVSATLTVPLVTTASSEYIAEFGCVGTPDTPGADPAFTLQVLASNPAGYTCAFFDAPAVAVGSYNLTVSDTFASGLLLVGVALRHN